MDRMPAIRQRAASLPSNVSTGITLAITGGDKAAVTRLADHARGLPVSVTTPGSNALPNEPDAIIYLLDYNQLLQTGEALPELGQALSQQLARWGKELSPGQRPLFLALYNWEKQAAGFALPQALDWLEERKRELLQQLSSVLARSGMKLREGFGSIQCRLWAVSLCDASELPGHVPLTNFGVAQLLEQAVRAAQQFRRRTRKQKQLLLLMGSACLVLLVGMTAGLLLLAGRLQPASPQVPGSDDPTAFLPLVERLAWWADRGRRLLRWEDWRKGHALTLDWPGWIAEVQRFRQAVAQLPQPVSPEAQIWAQALADISRQLTRIQARATLLGAGGDESVFGGGNRKGAPLAFVPGLSSEPRSTRETFDAFLVEVKDRLECVRRDFPMALIDHEPLPGDLPLEVAEDLRQLAELRYHVVLEPVRAGIRRQVLRLGEGKETIAAWRACVQEGWLSGAARRELANWLAILHLLQLWAGRQPVDPLDNLVQLVLQENVPLPLGRMFLVWPTNVSAIPVLAGNTATPTPPPAFADPPGELTMILLSPGQPQTVLVYQRVPAATSPDAKDTAATGSTASPPARSADARSTATRPIQRYEYRLATTVTWPGECYRYRPGVAMRILGRIRDTAGGIWQLSWSEREARSQVFGFTTLELTPRCHQLDQPPESGHCLPGVRLELSVPLPLPDLLP